MPKENNKMQVDIDNLFKQNVNDLLSIKELYRKLKELEEKITQVKYIDNTIVKKLKKEYENLKKIILDENIQVVLDNKINEINSDLFNVRNELNNKISYPIKSGEIGVTNINYIYGDVRRYGMNKPVRNDSIDDSEFFQNAINSAYNIKCDVIVSYGQYTINNTIYLPDNITIKGENKSQYRAEPKGTLIKTNCLELFKPKTALTVNMNISNLYFLNGGSKYATIFSCINIMKSNITNCEFDMYGTIVIGTFGLSKMHNNVFEGIQYKGFMSSSDGSNGITFTGGTGITDSNLYSNYFNGFPPSSSILFNCGVNSSMISNNYIDYFKKVFILSCTSTVITGNVFDICFCVFSEKANGYTCTANSFFRISKSYKSSMSSSDNDIQTKEWKCFNYNKDEMTDGFCKDITISSNAINDCDVFANIKVDSISNFKIVSNQFMNCTNEIKYIVKYYTDGIYIDILDNIIVSEVGESRVDKESSTFLGQRVIINNNTIKNINNKWYNSLGFRHWNKSILVNQGMQICAGNNIYESVTKTQLLDNGDMPTHTTGEVNNGYITWKFIKSLV